MKGVVKSPEECAVQAKDKCPNDFFSYSPIYTGEGYNESNCMCCSDAFLANKKITEKDQKKWKWMTWKLTHGATAV